MSRLITGRLQEKAMKRDYRKWANLNNCRGNRNLEDQSTEVGVAGFRTTVYFEHQEKRRKHQKIPCYFIVCEGE